MRSHHSRLDHFVCALESFMTLVCGDCIWL